MVMSRGEKARRGNTSCLSILSGEILARERNRLTYFALCLATGIFFPKEGRSSSLKISPSRREDTRRIDFLSFRFAAKVLGGSFFLFFFFSFVVRGVRKEYSLPEILD